MESTGLGGWTVVAVREVDEEAEAAAAEAAAQAKAQSQERGGQNEAKRSNGGGGTNPNADSFEGDDGPSGSSHRGVALGSDEAQDDEVYRVAQGQSVAFKKRPSASASASASFSASAGGAAPPKKVRAVRRREDND